MYVSTYVWVYDEMRNFIKTPGSAKSSNPADNLRQINLTQLLVQSRNIMHAALRITQARVIGNSDELVE